MLPTILLLSCAGLRSAPPTAAPPPPPPAARPPADAVRAHMAEHLAWSTRTRDAVIRGQLDTAQQGFAWMASHAEAEPAPPEWAGWMEGLRQSARAGAAATDLAEQARALGDMANQCGGCHQTLATGPTLPERPAPAAAPGFQPHMARHAWVNERMWAALVEPDGRAWVQSLEVLGATPMVAADLPTAGPVSAQLAMDAEVHRLAHAALADDNPDTRADLYGQIVTACASCHRVSRGEPPL